MNSVLVTGATGLVGRAVTEALASAGYAVCGVARKEPDWWPRNSSFLKMDLLRDDLTLLKPALKNVSGFLHVCDLGKVDIQRNKQVAQVCYGLCKEMGVRSFFYFSSIRVYGSLLGKVDETTCPRPFAHDKYGVCKLEIETLLSRLHEEGGPHLVVLRLGNVFSKETPHKFPEVRDAFTRFRYRGMNPHLIGATNVAYVVLQLLGGSPNSVQGVLNVTQECDGQNDNFYLVERMLGNDKAKPVVLSSVGCSIRAWLANRQGEGPAGYFNTVLEMRLNRLNIVYPETLLEQLMSAKRAAMGENRETPA